MYSLYEKDTITITEYNKLRDRLDRLQLFLNSNNQQSLSWIKPVDHFTVTLIFSGLGGEAVEEKIEIFCCYTYFYSNLGLVQSVTVFTFELTTCILSVTDKVKDAIINDLFKSPIIRSKHKKMRELLCCKFCKT